MEVALLPRMTFKSSWMVLEYVHGFLPLLSALQSSSQCFLRKILGNLGKIQIEEKGSWIGRVNLLLEKSEEDRGK
jgi:hypothetical protein